MKRKLIESLVVGLILINLVSIASAEVDMTMTDEQCLLVILLGLLTFGFVIWVLGRLFGV